MTISLAVERVALGLTGPVVVPPRPTCAFICLHGFGADGHDFVNLYEPLQTLLPAALAEGLLLACPHGPDVTPSGQGRQWFSDNNWTFRDRPGINRAKDLVWDFLVTLQVQHGVPFDRMVVCGFSQGAMTALYAAPRWPARVAGVIAHSGCAMYQEEVNGNTCQKPPVLFLHGAEDDVVPADASVAACGGLQRLGFETELHLLPGLGHGVNGDSLVRMGVWLNNVWA